ncbi:MAG TPA: amidohydrolase family protein, partial [Limnochordia bacterium]|nr:amidohydrolase family protein [Limnochordia bacterium]
GTIDCIATDHAPHTLEEKERTFTEAPFGIVGLETALGLSWSALVASGRMTPMRLIALLSANPARVLGLPGGRIAPGEPADLTLIDPKAEWVVDPDRFYSRGRNTPYAGAQLLARAAMTIVGGRIVMRDGEVLA